MLVLFINSEARLDLKAVSTSNCLCDIEQATTSFHSSVTLSVKWGNNSTHFIGTVYTLNELQQEQCLAHNKCSIWASN